MKIHFLVNSCAHPETEPAAFSFPSMNYDTSWFIGLLDQIAFSPQVNRPRD